MGNGWHSCFLKARGGCRGGRERERETYTDRHKQTDTHTHPTAREEAERERGEGEREISPKQRCASELEPAWAQAACWSSARGSGDLTCSSSSALLSLRLQTLAMSSQFQQVKCFKSCYFSLLGALCTLILALSGDWERRRKKKYIKKAKTTNQLQTADLGGRISHCRPVLPLAGTFCS